MKRKRKNDYISLSELDLPDCERCANPSRIIVGRTYDVEDPGVGGVLYNCANKKCKQKRERIVRYWQASNQRKEARDD